MLASRDLVAVRVVWREEDEAPEPAEGVVVVVAVASAPEEEVLLSG